MCFFQESVESVQHRHVKIVSYLGRCDSTCAWWPQCRWWGRVHPEESRWLLERRAARHRKTRPRSCSPARQRNSHHSVCFLWRRGVVVTELVVSTKLLYVEPGMGDVSGFDSRRRHFFSVCNQPTKANSAFHPFGVDKLSSEQLYQWMHTRLSRCGWFNRCAPCVAVI